MSKLTRRELMQIMGLGSATVSLSGCGPSNSGTTAAPRANSATNPTPRAFNIKLCVEGLTVISREFNGSAMRLIRLASLNATKNPDLQLHAHAPILSIPRGILKDWTIPALHSTHEYITWSTAGWNAAWTVNTSDGKTYAVGAETMVSEHAVVVNQNCDDVRDKWVNSRLVVNVTELSVERMVPNWHTSDIASGFLELPYGSFEDPELQPVGLEAFDGAFWYLGTTAAPKKGTVRALKPIARILMANVTSANISVQGKSIDLELLGTPSYEWQTMPIRVSNFGTMMHENDDFKAYYDLLAPKPNGDVQVPVADRVFPSVVQEDCIDTIGCGCCPPIQA